MLDAAARVVIAVAFGYFLAGIPFGVIVARKLYGVDITALGSGNTGATNVFRSLGWRPALVVAVLDVAKGAVPALAARFLLYDPTWSMSARDLFVIAAGAAAMAGHIYSPYFRFRGGKGVATAAGGILVLMPEAFVGLVLIFVLLVLTVRIVSVASILSALAFPALIWVIYHGQDRPVLFAFAGVAIVLIIWSHRSNIGRLIRGEEPRITMARRAHTGSDKERS
jgi:glycerol-3-phosphate acyltransferase PlsY